MCHLSVSLLCFYSLVYPYYTRTNAVLENMLRKAFSPQLPGQVTYIRTPIILLRYVTMLRGMTLRKAI